MEHMVKVQGRHLLRHNDVHRFTVQLIIILKAQAVYNVIFL